MNNTAHPVFVGNTPVNTSNNPVTGGFIAHNGEPFYQISNCQNMPPFFMTLVSPTDQWLFIASNGGLTAGRKNPESALFPYYTDDKIVDNAEYTGSKTLVKIKRDDKWLLWEPFSERYTGLYGITRNLYKNRIGNTLIFEEINADLALKFVYQWCFSDRYGFVKKASLHNLAPQEAQVEILDGLQNIIPAGVGSALQNNRSTLVDAYKKNELEPNGLGVFSLSSRIVDKAEPSESLTANTVWSHGLPNPTFLLSNTQLEAFRKGKSLSEERFVKATKGAYFVHSALKLNGKDQINWMTVAEVNQTHTKITGLQNQLTAPAQLVAAVNEDIARGGDDLQKLVGLADGLQLTADALSTGRHFSNVLYNTMRGGIFFDGYAIDLTDLQAYFKQINPSVFAQAQAFLAGLPQDLTYATMLDAARQTGNADIIRICTEYLPLSFSRRHGDPSRPWNNFNIHVQDAAGNRLRNYEGNWRDIFQNWEALAYTYPKFIEGMITKFLNASTLDGYNPYRITRQGIDWEVIEPDDPWSYIGYWGDHQIIYLLKLMEHAQAHFPEALGDMLAQNNFVYANVPYRIKSYADICKNPRDTIDFDHELQKTIEKRTQERGADGKLVMLAEGALLRASLAEKLLVTLLTKLYNYVPGAGIWLNTQRPEWNDANNALVGNGVSMVTLYYLRRFLVHVEALFAKYNQTTLSFHAPVATLLHEVTAVFENNPENTNAATDAAARKRIMDALGRAGEAYRSAAYSGFAKDTAEVSIAAIQKLIAAVLPAIDQTIRLNKREDGLYHAYNIIRLTAQTVEVDYLYEMLEGQVAVLSSGALQPEEALDVLDALKQSAMYRSDQYSYMLYPDRTLSPFVEKNRISEALLKDSKLVNALKAQGNTSLLEQDAKGDFHFNAEIKNAADLQSCLEKLAASGFKDEVAADQALIFDIYEQLFNHASFTGRSGTFYGYEGLGCIYWHMVSKLLLATQEAVFLGVNAQTPKAVLGRLVDHYYEIRAGIGINKSPELYGAFPTDAYSHTPGNAGVQQPGMTGQVKEDILNRWAELGLQVENGLLTINPYILNPAEFLSEAQTFRYVDALGHWQQAEVNLGELAFTYCGVLFRYQKGNHPSMHVKLQDGETLDLETNVLPQEWSEALFNRTGILKEILVVF